MAFFALVAVSTGASGCTIALKSDKFQCTTDLDCTSRGGAFRQTFCSKDSVCVDVTSTGCTSNEKCTAAKDGTPHICKQLGGPCVPVLSEECSTLIPKNAKMKDNAILFAFTGLKTGSEAEAHRISYNMVEMGLTEVNASIAGLPGGPNGTSRPIIGLECDETRNGTPDDERVKRSYDHIVKDLGIQAVITNSYSSTTVKVVDQYVKPYGIFLMPNLSLSPVISTLDDNGLVWRTSSPASAQGAAQAALVQLVENKLRTQATNPITGDIRVALVTSTAVVFSSIADVIQDKLRFNNGKSPSQNGSNFKRLSHTAYNDDPNVDLAPVASELVAFRPHIIIATDKGNDFWETNGKPKGIGPVVESRWDPAQSRPIYVIASPTFEKSGDYVRNTADAAKREDLRKRIVGVDQSFWNQNAFDNFTINYRGNYKTPEEDFVAKGLNNYVVEYDSIYATIYAMYAAAQKNPGQPITGKAIAEAIPRLMSGDQRLVGPTDITQVTQQLAIGNSVDLQGIFSKLDFDLTTGDSPTETSVVCLEPFGSTLEWKFSALKWDRNANGGNGGLVGDQTSCSIFK
ncbi:hypothetical protein [Pendulispora albinea]|uniref:Uncharacterized protein n=1 Tax=Pendulispora albinea TaxID=2741071 RepID=A0ABZ2LS53_9BACT